jgi:serine/threonine protein kinase
MLGTQILNYKLTALIGEGGMGHVYLGEHVSLGRKAAIKVLLQQYANNPEIRARFKNEASALSRLHHPNIVTLYDYVETEDMLCLVMEYVEGHNLDHYIANIRGPIPEAVALPLFDQILMAFAYAHSIGVIHRDIKPSNIIITPDSKVKILDFGIAKMLEHTDHKLTRTGSRIGTVLYMSPELVQGKTVDLRSDIYSLGVTLFQMLSGKEPYDKTLPEFEIYNNIVHNPLPRVKDFYPRVSSHVQDIIDKSTRKDPEERFDSCEQFLAALHPTKITKNEAEYVNPTEFADPIPPAVVEPTGKPRKQKRPVYIRVISLILLLLTIGGIWALYNWYTTSVNVSYYVLADKLLLRPTKGDDNIQNAIATLRYGTPVQIVEKDAFTDSEGLTWCKVRPDGTKNEGYVALNYLAPQGEFKKLDNIFKANDKAQQYTKVAFKKALNIFFEKNNLYTKTNVNDQIVISTDWAFDGSAIKVENNIAAVPDLNNDRREDYVCLLRNNVTNERWLVAFTFQGADEAKQVIEKKLPVGSYKVRKASKDNLYFVGKYTVADSTQTKAPIKEGLSADGFILNDYTKNRTWLYLYNEKEGTVKEIEQ